MIITNWIITEHIENQIESKINQFQSYVEFTKNCVIENNINICKNIAKNKSIISAIENRDSEAINSIIQNSYNIADCEYMQIADTQGNVLLKSDILAKGIDISKMQSLSEYIIFLLVNDKEHYLVSTVPVQIQDINIGTISIGNLINRSFKFESINEIKNALLNGQNIIYSQFDNHKESITDFIKTHRPIIDAVLATSQSSDMFSTHFDGDKIYSKILPFGYGVPMYFLVSISKSNEFRFLDTLNKYLLYISIFCGLLLLITFLVIARLYSQQIDKLKSEMKIIKEKPEKTDELIVEKTKQPEILKDLTGTILISKIICLSDAKDEKNESFLNVFSSYHKIQNELIELYDGKVENNINNQIIASFMGNEDAIDKSIQCSQTIMKLLNKESESTNCKIAVALNYGSIFYSNGEKSALFGSTLEMTEAIIQVAKPGQILIKDKLISTTDMDYSIAESKSWKFKNIKDEVRLVDISKK
ncbi:MAG: hypothetical protein KAS18_01635 [Calditrichia bacterium]|nr:hypothetical protein [Calditrichia bacterium]